MPCIENSKPAIILVTGLKLKYLGVENGFISNGGAVADWLWLLLY